MQQNSPFGELIIDLNEIDSTNNYAMRLINEGMAEHGLAIRADFQSNGKGQHGNVWMAEESKNLLCSVIADTKGLAMERQFTLNCMTCIALTELLMQQYHIRNVSIKWPNDIYAGNRKIAGILIENNIRGTQWCHAVIGIGLNVNQLEFPYLNTATSLKMELKRDFKIKFVLKHLLKILGIYYEIFLRNANEIMNLYNSYLMNIGNDIEYYKKNELTSGTLLRVNSLGQIEINENGKLKKYKHKEIELLI